MRNTILHGFISFWNAVADEGFLTMGSIPVELVCGCLLLKKETRVEWDLISETRRRLSDQRPAHHPAAVDVGTDGPAGARRRRRVLRRRRAASGAGAARRTPAARRLPAQRRVEGRPRRQPAQRRPRHPRPSGGPRPGGPFHPHARRHAPLKKPPDAPTSLRPLPADVCFVWFGFFSIPCFVSGHSIDRIVSLVFVDRQMT